MQMSAPVTFKCFCVICCCVTVIPCLRFMLYAWLCVRYKFSYYYYYYLPITIWVVFCAVAKAVNCQVTATSVTWPQWLVLFLFIRTRSRSCTSPEWTSVTRNGNTVCKLSLCVYWTESVLVYTDRGTVAIGVRTGRSADTLDVPVFIWRCEHRVWPLAVPFGHCKKTCRYFLSWGCSVA